MVRYCFSKKYNKHFLLRVLFFVLTFLPVLLESTVTVQLYLPMPQIPLPCQKLSWSMTYLFSNDWGKRIVNSTGGNGEFA